MKYLLRPLNWCLCLGLRCNAWLANRAHERLKSGPSARLWAASDHELLAEAKRRGLLRRRPKSVTRVNTEAEIEPQTKTVHIEEQQVILAIKAVHTLQQVPMTQAEKLVRQVVGKWTGSAKPSADQLAALVLKPAHV